MDSKKFADDKYNTLRDKINIVNRRKDSLYTNFLSPDEQYFIKLDAKEEGVNVDFFGGNGSFERAVGKIYIYECEDSYPVAVIRAEYDNRFNELTHRDFLGSLMSLGIKRETIGDINLYDDAAEIWVKDEIKDYILLNFNKIKRASIKCAVIDPIKARIREIKYKDIIINSASLRFDAIISSITGLSRQDASSLIKGKNAKVNYTIEDEISKKLKEGDIISIKGYGRYILCEVIGFTKRDRTKILIKKYE